MKLIKVDDINCDALLIYKQLRDNAFTHDNSFIADSPKVVNLLLETDIKVKSILATQEYYDEFMDLVNQKSIESLYVADKKEMEKIVGHRVHHNCMMHGVRPSHSTLKDLGEKVIMLDEITSSENVGSIARSATALGVNSYILSKKSPHPFQRRALRVSMGHSALLNIHIYTNIYETVKELKREGYRVFAAEVTQNSTPLSKVISTKKWVLIMGHEGRGIAKEILDICDEVVSIEMQDGIKSFNVSVAASIMMYEFTHNSPISN